MLHLCHLGLQLLVNLLFDMIWNIDIYVSGYINVQVFLKVEDFMFHVYVSWGQWFVCAGLLAEVPVIVYFHGNFSIFIICLHFGLLVTSVYHLGCLHFKLVQFELE